MPRIQPVNVATATGEAATQLAAARAKFGSTPNLVTTTANSPATLEAMISLFKTFGGAPLGGKIGELIALTVSQANNCGYCLSAHSAFGRMLGLNQEALTSARQAISTDPKTDALLKLALAIVESRGSVDNAAIAAARSSGVSDGEIIELIGQVSLTIFTNYVNNVSQTDIDFPEVPVALAA